jgi:hypothetical protein
MCPSGFSRLDRYAALGVKQGAVREKKAALEAFSFNSLSALRFLGLYGV